jgi:CheY-like chemotaxis protein
MEATLCEPHPGRSYRAAAAGTVLVVDDHPDCVEPLAKMLRYHGHPVETAGNGMEALGVLARVRPDVVILDLMMPVMDGVSFLEVMRRNPAWNDIKVIAFSGYCELCPAARLRALGVSEVLPKGSTDFGRLLDAVLA